MVRERVEIGQCAAIVAHHNNLLGIQGTYGIYGKCTQEMLPSTLQV